MNIPSNAMALVMDGFARYPLLTAEQEIALARQVRAWQELQEQKPERATFQQWTDAVDLSAGELRRVEINSKRARDRLVLCNQRLALSIAKRYRHRGLELEDCFQLGCLGLMKAARKFDPERGYRFATYASWWVRQSIARGIQDQSRAIRLPSHIWEKLNACLRYCREQQQQGNSSIAEAVAELAIPEQFQTPLERALQPLMELDRVVPGTDAANWVDVLPNREPDEAVALEQSEVERILPQLPELQRAAIALRWGFEDGQLRTFKQVGELLGRSRERIRQLEKAGVEQIAQRVFV